jgi:NDP-sugar pyrophosphorylase family protein
MTESPPVLYLAAGKSTRIHPISGGLPKPLLEIAGTAIAARNLRWLAWQGLSNVFVNLHYRPEEIREFMGDGSKFGLNIRYSFEQEILGTAGAAKYLADHWQSRFLVVYGDNLLSTNIAALLAAHETHHAMATIAVFDRGVHPHTGIAGGRVRIDDTGRILEFTEGAGDDISSLVNAGVYVLEPAVLDHVPSGEPCDFGKDVFPAMLAAGQPLFASSITDYCLGIDTPETFEIVNALISSGKVQLR